MRIEVKRYCVIVEKEKGDKRFYSGYSFPESTFLHHVKLGMIKQGFDVIKKRMWKDGNMVDDTQQYIRTRNLEPNDKQNSFCVYNGSYSIYDAGEMFNSLKVGESVVFVKEDL